LVTFIKNKGRWTIVNSLTAYPVSLGVVASLAVDQKKGESFWGSLL